MRTDWTGTYSVDSLRDFSIVYYTAAAWADLITGRRVPTRWTADRYYPIGSLALDADNSVLRAVQASLGVVLTDAAYWTAAVAADYVLPAATDLSDLVESASHTPSEMRFDLAFAAIDQVLPAPGDLIVVVDNTTGQNLWAGQMESIDSRVERRGQRTASCVARSRDASPLWRQAHWSTQPYPVGTELAVMVADVAKSLRLDPVEFPALQPFGRWAPHTTNQLADSTAWDMFSTLLFPVLQSPWVDAVGRFKPISRDVRREADLVLTGADVLSVGGSKSARPITSVTLRWLDHVLSKSSQQDQALGQASVTAGFFALQQHANVYWNKDRAQRAEKTRMVTLQSANSAEISFCTESYRQVDQFHGRITVETSDQVPVIIAAALTSALYGLGLGDLVVALGGGYTVRVGSLITDVALLGLVAVLRQVGTGTYEVWGQPFDYVYAVNTTEVYARGVRPWEQADEALQCDLITDESHAQQVALGELLYRSLAASSYQVDVVDNPRIEPGDILLLPNATRLYVTDYSRLLRRGAPAVLSLSGFRV